MFYNENGKKFTIESTNRWNKLNYGVKDVTFRNCCKLYHLSDFIIIKSPWGDYSEIAQIINDKTGLTMSAVSAVYYYGLAFVAYDEHNSRVKMFFISFEN